MENLQSLVIRSAADTLRAAAVRDISHMGESRFSKRMKQTARALYELIELIDEESADDSE